MICCIAALFLHLGGTVPSVPQAVVAPAFQTAPQSGTLTKRPLASAAVCDDSGTNSQTPSVAPTREPQSAESIRVISADSVPSRRRWMILSAGQHGAAAFDAFSTRHAITRGAIETDPLMRPFAHSPEIYAATQIGPALLDILARHMQRSRNNLWRRTWWVPQSASTSLFLFSGIHDLQVAKKL